MKGESAKFEESQPFRFLMDIAFVITGRGTVVCGTVQSGVVRVNDCLELQRGSAIDRFLCTGVELVNKRPVTPGYLGLRLAAENGESVGPDRFGAGDVLQHPDE